MIQRARVTPAVALVLSFVVLSSVICLTAAAARAQTAPAGPRVTLGSDAKNRYIRLSGGVPVYPTVDLTCDGKRWSIGLARAEGGAVYEISRANVETMLNALECRLLLPDQEIPLSRQQLWAAWSNPTQWAAGAPSVLVGQVIDIIDGNTILVNLGERSETVRYIGIAPQESTRRPAPAEPTPGSAVEANRQLVARQQVRMELEPLPEDLQITRQRLRLAADVHHPIRRELDDRLQHLA